MLESTSLQSVLSVTKPVGLEHAEVVTFGFP
jgi:hypothetical protein